MQEPDFNSLNMDDFSHMMEYAIHMKAIRMTIEKEAGSDEYGVSCTQSSVMNFFFFLNAVEPLFTSMLNELQRLADDPREKATDARGLAKAYAELIGKELEAAAEIYEKKFERGGDANAPD